MAYFKKVFILDTVYFFSGKALVNRICGQSLIKIKSTQMCTINNVRKPSNYLSHIAKQENVLSGIPYFYSYKEGNSDLA